MEMLWQWSDTPNICIWDNKYNHLFAKGFVEWNEALYSLGEEWILEGRIVDGDTPEYIVRYCHINVILVEHDVTKNEEFTGILGRTSYAISGEISRVFVVIYEERDPAYYFNFDDAIVKTVKHELGHAFGLNHWMPENIYEGLRPWPASIMWKYSDKMYNGTIDNYTLDALTCWYGEDAWGGHNDRLCESIQLVTIPKVNNE